MYNDYDPFTDLMPQELVEEEDRRLAAEAKKREPLVLLSAPWATWTEAHRQRASPEGRVAVDTMIITTTSASSMLVREAWKPDPASLLGSVIAPRQSLAGVSATPGPMDPCTYIYLVEAGEPSQPETAALVLCQGQLDEEDASGWMTALLSGLTAKRVFVLDQDAELGGKVLGGATQSATFLKCLGDAGAKMFAGCAKQPLPPLPEKATLQRLADAGAKVLEEAGLPACVVAQALTLPLPDAAAIAELAQEAGKALAAAGATQVGERLADGVAATVAEAERQWAGRAQRHLFM